VAANVFSQKLTLREPGFSFWILNFSALMAGTIVYPI